MPRSEDPNAHDVLRDLPWPFPSGLFPSQLGAVIQRTVLSGELPALQVIHDDDNRWLVGDGVSDPNQPGACSVGHMIHVVEMNSSAASLASLPPGWLAWRGGAGEPWQRERHHYPDDSPADLT